MRKKSLWLKRKLEYFLFKKKSVWNKAPPIIWLIDPLPTRIGHVVMFCHAHQIRQLIPELRFLNFFRISLFLTNQTMTNKQTNCVKLVLIRQIIYENSELRSSNWLLDPVNKIFLQIPCSLEGESFLISWGVAFTIGMIVWINTFFW